VNVTMDLLHKGEKTIVFSEFKTAGVELVQKRLDKEGIPYVTITGSIPKKRRAEIVNVYNKDEVKILFITKAGGEGLDLKGTRNIILMEKGWTKSLEDQVTGRGIRYESHTHLPKNERVVTVHHLILIKPSDEKYIKSEVPTGLPKGYRESADLYLHKLAFEKRDATDTLIKRLDAVDIFHKKCIVEDEKSSIKSPAKADLKVDKSLLSPIIIEAWMFQNEYLWINNQIGMSYLMQGQGRLYYSSPIEAYDPVRNLVKTTNTLYKVPKISFDRFPTTDAVYNKENYDIKYKQLEKEGKIRNIILI